MPDLKQVRPLARQPAQEIGAASASTDQLVYMLNMLVRPGPLPPMLGLGLGEVGAQATKRAAGGGHERHCYRKGNPVHHLNCCPGFPSASPPAAGSPDLVGRRVCVPVSVTPALRHATRPRPRRRACPARPPASCLRSRRDVGAVLAETTEKGCGGRASGAIIVDTTFVVINGFLRPSRRPLVRAILGVDVLGTCGCALVARGVAGGGEGADGRGR